MSKPDRKPSKKINRKPLRRQRIGTTTIALTCLQRDDAPFLVIARRDGVVIHRKYFRDRRTAETDFDTLATGTEGQGLEATMSITEADRRALLQFKEDVKGWAKPPTVAQALAQYVEDHKKVGVGRTVAQIAEGYIHGLERDGMSFVHVKGVRERLGRFCKELGERRIGSIKREDIQNFLHGLNVGAITRRNYLRAISPLVSDAMTTGEITANPLKGVKVGKIVPNPKSPWTPSEAARLLANCPERSVAAIALQMFGGLRRSEALRLNWEKVNLVERVITVDAGKAKTAKRRTCPISDTLLAWLQPLAKTSGPVAPSGDCFDDDLDRIKARTGIKWRKNGSRDAFISYSLKGRGTIAEVAEVAGNSTKIIHESYKSLASVSDANAYFAIRPQGEAEIIPFKEVG